MCALVCAHRMYTAACGGRESVTGVFLTHAALLVAVAAAAVT